jgi:7,8-dihydropterin-6-yl-methyl-4-(beta-D-ribofuranosyl)aminobenzene 5'-phosphate synthase
MSAIDNFGAVKRASITVLVDNKADLIVQSDERVKYFEDAPLLAEHGFSALVRLDDAFTLLWDAGVSRVALVENLRRMHIDPAAIDKIALSHGHLDHYAAMTDVLTAMDLLTMDKEWQQQPDSAQVQQWVESHRKTLVAHPAAFRERWLQKDDGGLVGPFESPSRGAWEAAGVKLVLSADPYQLAPGCWTTGYVPRRSFEDSGRPKKLLYREGDAFLKDDLEDDQAVVINVTGRGLVVLSGCAHAGILNTVEYAREISGVEQVHSVIGGFHLARAEETEIQRTVNHLRSLNPRQLVPCHCTGLRALCQFALQMPGQFIEGVVGATYTF